MKRILLIMAVIFVAGCLGGNGVVTSEGLGVEITEFTVEPTQVPSGTSARFTVTVENQGESVMNDIRSLIYLFGTNLNFDDESGISWYNTGESHFKEFSRDLKPADPLKDIPADKKTFTWRITSPTLTRGQSVDYKFTARIYYDYETKARGTVWIYSPAEEEAARSAGTQLDKSSFTVTEGPLDMEITIIPEPPVITEGDEVFLMYIKLVNKGDGIIYEPGAIDYGNKDIKIGDGLNRVEVSIPNLDIKNIRECIGDQDFIEGLDIVCEIEVGPPDAKTSLPVEVTVKYGYYKESEVSVTVTGR